MLTDYRSSFTSELSNEMILNILSHLKCVVTLPCKTCQHTSNNLKQLTCLTVNFNLFITVKNVLTNLYYSEYSKCPILARMQPSGYWSVALSITLFHSNPRISQMLPQTSHMFCPVESLLELCPRFCSQLE